MSRTIEAVYEKGVFKPTFPIDIAEHKKVTLVIEDEPTVSSDILSLAATVYGDLSPSDIVDIEMITLDRSHFSRDRN